jgi:hypothetical protein
MSTSTVNECKRCNDLHTSISQWFDAFLTQWLLPTATLISTVAGQPCDVDGYDLPGDTPPTPEHSHAEDDYFPYSLRPEFELADLLFQRVQMAGSKISDLMDIWAAYQQIYKLNATHGPPFSSAQDLYNTIDSTEVGNVPWQAFLVEFNGENPGESEGPSWKRKSYEVWF